MNILLKNISYLDVINEKIVRNVNIHIQDNIIKEIYSEDKKLFNFDYIIDCSNKLASPAFTNGHTHLGMTQMRNYADDLELMTWLNEKIFPVEARLTSEDIYYASLLSIIENIKSGVGNVCDMYDSIDRVSDAIIESGIRGFISMGLTSVSGDVNKKLDKLYSLYKEYNNQGSGRLKILPGPHAIYTCSKEFLKMVLDLSEKMDNRLNIHVSETETEVNNCIKENGVRPIEYLNQIGFMDKKIIAAHCVHLNKEEIEFISDKEFYPIYNPTSNLKLASGFTDIDYMLKNKIKVGIGTDGSSSNNNQDMIEEMHIGSIVNKAVNSDPKSVKAIDVLRMATINASEIFDVDNGEIKEGKLADICMFDLDSISFTPQNNLISALVYSANRSDVTDLIVDGKFIMRNREILSLDEEKIKYKVRELSEKLLNC